MMALGATANTLFGCRNPFPYKTGKVDVLPHAMAVQGRTGRGPAKAQPQVDGCPPLGEGTDAARARGWKPIPDGPPIPLSTGCIQILDSSWNHPCDVVFRLLQRAFMAFWVLSWKPRVPPALCTSWDDTRLRRGQPGGAGWLVSIPDPCPRHPHGLSISLVLYLCSDGRPQPPQVLEAARLLLSILFPLALPLDPTPQAIGEPTGALVQRKVEAPTAGPELSKSWCLPRQPTAGSATSLGLRPHPQISPARVG